MSEERPFWYLSRRDLLKLLPPGVAGWVVEALVEDGSAHAMVVPFAPPEAKGKRWTAKWIWCEGEPVPQNFYLYCRKVLTLEDASAEASVDVTADSRYKLFVNGRFVGRGPARCDQRWEYYDTYDLRSFLQPGENVVSAIVHQYGAPSHSYTLGRGGFLLQGEVRERGGRPVNLDSDDSWRVLPAPQWDRGSPRVCVAIMWMEIYDARKEPLGWQLKGFDDSNWRKPVILGSPPVFPWENLVARDIPFLREEMWLPSAIVNSGVADPAPPPVHLDFPRLFGTSDGQMAYLFACLKSPVQQQMAMALRGYAGMPPMMTRIWLNGEPPTQLQGQGFEPTPSASVFNLRQGWNELLVKLGRFSPAWKWDIAIGPATGRSFKPIEWHADSQDNSPSGQVLVMGPYGHMGPPAPGTPIGPQAFEIPYEPEKAILGRAPGSPVNIPGKVVELDSAGMKNVALLIAMEKRHPQSTPKLQNVERLLKSGNGTVLVSTAGEGGNPYLTIDFGKEVAGFVRLRMNGVAGGIADLGYSEKLVDGHVDTLRDQWSFADRYIMRDGPQEWELFFWKGFRYLQLTFRDCTRPVELESVDLRFTSYPSKYRGSFECSDALLTKIWDVGRWTLQLCMHDGYEDCPWREQGQWCGDAQVELHSNYVAFGDIALGSKCLRQLAQGQDENGALPAEYPADISVYPKRQHVPPQGTIPTFMAQWVNMVLDHYRYTGDSKIVSELYPNVVRVMEYLSRYLDNDGLLNDVPGFVFLDWAPAFMSPAMSSRGELTGMNCHYYRALLNAAKLANLIGEKSQEQDWLSKAEALKRAINEKLWSEDRGVYAHVRSDGQVGSLVAVHDSILAAYSGVAPTDRISTSFGNLLGKPAGDVVQIGTPYFYFFYLRALRGADRHQEALDATRRSYGEMLEAGATTWWEQFGGFASLCHAWSSAPTSDLSTHVLGVQPTAPGFAEFRVEPQPCDLKWAKGVVPTPRGDVEVDWTRRDSRFELNVVVPMKSVVELSVPARSLEATRLTSKTPPQKRVYAAGRARYWMLAPGKFRVEGE